LNLDAAVRMSGIELDYEALLDHLRAAGMQPLSELHGGLCGVMSAGGRDPARRWLVQQLDDLASDSDEDDALAAALERLEAETWRALSGSAMEFEPLLPAGSAALDERVAALAAWCDGFLSGLALGGWRPEHGDQDGPGELDEIIRDLVEISKAGVDSDEREDPDAAEFLFVELSEFVRVSVQVVFETLGSQHEALPRATIH
jgi:yecA family protein